MKKKYIIFVLCGIFIFSTIIVFKVNSSYAFLKDVKEIKNTYTVGNISITLDEANVSEHGLVIDEKRVIQNYYHLMPGYTYVKDPVVTILNGSVDSYIRILIKIDKISILKEIYGENFTLNDLYNNFNPNWIYSGETLIDDTITYEYRYKTIVNGLNEDKKLEPLFDSFTIKNDLTKEQLTNLSNLEIKITAEAIQATGFQDENTAWQSFA